MTSSYPQKFLDSLHSKTFLKIAAILLNIFRCFLQSNFFLLGMACILLFCEFYIPGFYYSLFGKIYNPNRLFDICFYCLLTFLFFFIIPVFITRYCYQFSLKEIGLSLPLQKNLAWLLASCALSILLPFVIYLARQPSFLNFYHLQHPTGFTFIFFQLIIFPFYYFCEEFFFRGFLLIILWKKMKWHSFWITDIIFTVAHVTKPPLEILVALPAGILFAFLSLKTRSIYPSMWVHYILGMIMILTVNQIL